jgi:hypothetical protein
VKTSNLTQRVLIPLGIIQVLCLKHLKDLKWFYDSSRRRFTEIEFLSVENSTFSAKPWNTCKYIIFYISACHSNMHPK